jgi:hypothetical protein
MRKRPTKPQTHSWAIYHAGGTPAKFIGLVHDAPDEAKRYREGDRGIQSAGQSARAANRAAAGLRVAGGKATAERPTTAHRSRPALPAGRPGRMGEPQPSAGIVEAIEDEMRAAVLSWAMPFNFRINLIC